LALELKLTPEDEGKTKEEISALMDIEVEKFSEWMENLSDWRAKGALSKPEKALVKTYLVQKLQGKI
jgi:predicted acetyltransferase